MARDTQHLEDEYMRAKAELEQVKNDRCTSPELVARAADKVTWLSKKIQLSRRRNR